MTSTTFAPHSDGAAKTRDVELALELASSLQPLWLTRGHVTEGLAWLDAALSVAAADQPGIRPARARALADKALLLASVGVPEGVDEAEEALGHRPRSGGSHAAGSGADGARICQCLRRRGVATVSRRGRRSCPRARRFMVVGTNPQLAGDRSASGRRHGGDLGRPARKRLNSRQRWVIDSSSRASRLWLASARTYRAIWRGAVAQFREVIDEAAATHDVLSAGDRSCGQELRRGLHGDVRRRAGLGGSGTGLLDTTLSSITTFLATGRLRSRSRRAAMPLRPGRRVKWHEAGQRSGIP